MSLSGYRIGYFFREAAQNVRHSPVLAGVSVLTIAVALLLVGFFGWILVHGQSVLESVGDELRLSIYLEPDTTEAQLDSLAAEVRARPEVADVVAFDAERDRRRNEALLDPEIIDGLDPASIPGQPTLDVTLVRQLRGQEEIDALTAWVDELSGVSGVQEVQFAVDKYRFVYALIDIFQLVGLLVGAIVLFAAVFFVFGTIKLAVYARADEIEVLRLVGATGNFIRAPFYIEGALQGLLGSAVALLGVLAIHLKVQHYVTVERAIKFEGELLSTSLWLWFLVGGTLLGLLGSAFSVGRHLRV